jgi:hypothetical protein
MQWRPIETAPKDGTFVLLRGGKESTGEKVAPVVVAFFDPNAIGAGDGGWAYAHWFGGWRSYYDSPVEWMPVPGASLAQWVEAQFNQHEQESPSQ